MVVAIGNDNEAVGKDITIHVAAAHPMIAVADLSQELVNKEKLFLKHK